jgi:hypothetical protein
MNTHTIRKVFAAAAISTAIGFTSLAGGAASADGPSLSLGTSATETWHFPGNTKYSTVLLTRASIAGAGGVNTETLEVAHVGLKPSAPIHTVKDITMKRGLVEPARATKYQDIELKPAVVEAPSYHLAYAWPK